MWVGRIHGGNDGDIRRDVGRSYSWWKRWGYSKGSTAQLFSFLSRAICRRAAPPRSSPHRAPAHTSHMHYSILYFVENLSQCCEELNFSVQFKGLGNISSSCCEELMHFQSGNSIFAGSRFTCSLLRFAHAVVGFSGLRD